MLTDDNSIGYLHRNKSDITHYFHGGSPLAYLIVHPDGRLDRKMLGADLERGQQLQLLVPGGCWKASELESGEFGLISEAVAPGFDYADMELATGKPCRASFRSYEAGWLNMSNDRSGIGDNDRVSLVHANPSQHFRG